MAFRTPRPRRSLALLLLPTLLAGCSAGIRLHDEPKAGVAAAAKASYASVEVPAIIEAEKRNLARLLEEELKAVRDNNRIQLDFVLLSMADDATPMGDTYAGEALGRIAKLGFENPAHLRRWLIADFGIALRSRELDDRARRIRKATGAFPKGCKPNGDLPESTTLPEGLTPQQQSIANINYRRYREACEKRKAEQQSVSPPGGLVGAAHSRWKQAQQKLSDRTGEVAARKQEVADARKAYDAALAEQEKAEGSGEVLEKKVREAAGKVVEAKDKLDKLDAGVLAGENVTHIVTLLTAAAGDEVDTEDPELRTAAEVVRELPSLAGDMKELIESAKAPTVSNLLIQMRHQLLRMEHAKQLQTLAEERVAILKEAHGALVRETRRWLEFTDAMCSYAVVSAKQPFPGEACDTFEVSVGSGAAACSIAGKPIAECALDDPWNKSINRAKDGAAREIYKALAAYVRALSLQSAAREQSFRLLDVRHRETLAAKEVAVRAWNNLVDTPITQLDAYYQAGLKPAEISDLLVKALGFVAITVGVSQ